MTTTKLRKHKYWFSPASDRESTDIIIVSTDKITIEDDKTMSYVITGGGHIARGGKPVYPRDSWYISRTSKFIPLTEAKYNLICNIMREDT